MKKTLLAASLIAFSMGASAVEKDQSYIGITLGSSEVDFDLTDTRAATYGLVGGYQFDDRMSIELAYQKSDKIKDVESSSGVTETAYAEITRTQVGLRYDIIKGIQTDFSAMVGMQRWTSDDKVENSVSGVTAQSEDSGTDPYLGLGIKHEIRDDIYLGFDYKITKHSHPDYEKSIRFNEWAVSLTRSF